MPVETAQYINTLQPDWPLGTDPESAGDDHIRLVKQVLKNTFPNIDSQVTGTPTQINNITLNTPWQDNSATAGALSNFNLTDPAKGDGSLAALAIATPTAQQSNLNPALAVTWLMVQSLIYPVGVVIVNTGANPLNYLGFGTWVQRAGTIYGVGDCADQNGYNKAITPGAHNTDAYWRVQNGHIVAQGMSVTLTMDAVADHSHNIGTTHIETSSQNAGTISNGSYDGVGGYAQSEPGGAHTPTGSGSFTLGTGGVADGAQLMQPGYAFTVWERTA